MSETNGSQQKEKAAKVRRKPERESVLTPTFAAARHSISGTLWDRNQQGSGLLQRQYACGTHTIGGVERDAYRKKREASFLQRTAVSNTHHNFAASESTEIQDFPAVGVGQDFSRMPVRNHMAPPQPGPMFTRNRQNDKIVQAKKPLDRVMLKRKIKPEGANGTVRVKPHSTSRGQSQVTNMDVPNEQVFEVNSNHEPDHLNRSNVIQQRQTPSNTSTIQRYFDGDESYRLRLDRTGGTNYDARSQQYTLSMWDYRHLSRIHGFYFLTTSTIQLIAPPEVRHRRVLIELSNSEFARFRRAADPVQAIRVLIQRHLNVSVDNLTRSTGSDEDFSIPSLPASVGQILSTQAPIVSDRDRAAVERQRRRAAGMTQARTQSFARDRGEELPMEELTWSDRMDPNTWGQMDDPALAAWFVTRLGRFQAQLFESAQTNRIPMQLLAAVTLNELGDINFLDVLQSGPSTFRGSLGIAQIQIDTAISDRLVDLPAGAAEEGYRRANLHTHGPMRGAQRQFGERLRVGQLLQIPQVAIEAAAREIKLLITRMAANHGSPWQRRHNFTASGPVGNAIYDHVGSNSDSQATREATLAKMVSGAYNSPNVITARDTSQFPNANIHGNNASYMAMKLFQFQLFRTN